MTLIKVLVFAVIAHFIPFRMKNTCARVRNYNIRSIKAKYLYVGIHICVLFIMSCILSLSWRCLGISRAQNPILLVWTYVNTAEDIFENNKLVNVLLIKAIFVSNIYSVLYSWKFLGSRDRFGLLNRGVLFHFSHCVYTTQHHLLQKGGMF